MRIAFPELVALATALLASCSSLSIDVAQFVGDQARSHRTRLAEARGKANLALAVIEESPLVKEYFTRLAPTRQPGDYLDRINRFADRLNEPVRYKELSVPNAAGLPRPGERISIPGVNPPQSDPVVLTGPPPAVAIRALNALEKELRELGALLASVDPQDFALEPDLEKRNRALAVVGRLNALGRQVVMHTEFPDYGELVDVKYADQWRIINPVSTFGGLGKSEFVVFKDDAGNYQVKSAIFDPSDVIQAASATVTGVLTTFAQLHGVPLPGSTQADAIPGVVSGPLMEADTRELAARSERLKACDQALVVILGDVQARELQDPNFDADAARRALERVRQALDLYRQRVTPLLTQTP